MADLAALPHPARVALREIVAQHGLANTLEDLAAMTAERGTADVYTHCALSIERAAHDVLYFSPSWRI